MKCLTIKQPFAALIINGYKIYEFRTWKTNYRGKVLIHAGKSKSENLSSYEEYNLDYVYGAIIGEVTITDCIKVDEKFKNELKLIDSQIYKDIINDDTWKGYAFKLENIKKISPVFINGKLGLWDYNINCTKKKLSNIK